MKNSFYISLILLSIISCKRKDEKIVIYKKDTKDVLFYNNEETIKNKSAQDLFKKGLYDVESEDFESAKENFLEADKIENKNPTILNGIAQAEARLGNIEKSNEISLNILSIDSTYVETYVNLGGNYMSTKDYEKARDILTKGLRFTENKSIRTKSILLLNLAITYNNLGDFKNGLKYSDEALKISKDKELTEFANKVKLESEENLE
jgi:tetratricopeptide (TPR) repeat protein